MNKARDYSTGCIIFDTFSHNFYIPLVLHNVSSALGLVVTVCLGYMLVQHPVSS